VDLTGDGIVDLVLASNTQWSVYPGYYNGGAWAFRPAKIVFTPTLALSNSTVNLAIRGGDPYDSTAPSTTVDLIDMNGDGLPDRILSSSDSSGTTTTWQIEYNNGSNFVMPTQFFPGDFVVGTVSDRSSGLLVDINRDGRVDYLTSNSSSCSAGFTARLNGGLSLSSTDTCVPGPSGYSPYSVETVLDYMLDGSNAQFVDVDGDGQPDYVAADAGSWWNWYLSNSFEAPPADLLFQVRSTTGLTTSISYLPSSDYDVAPQSPIYPVVWDVYEAGPAVPSLETRHWYSGLQTGMLWDEPKPESLGFANTVAQDSVTSMLQAVTWGNAHFDVGMATAVTLGRSCWGLC
ncbi:MAG TPA: hypothetical protein VKT80_13400, partial [Chloroflexota bacterium]|nr:hypothetical protein [Chloroflexota bacterium]